MLSKSNVSVVDIYRMFKERDINVTFLVPTETGLQKSIMDATQEVRRFLESTGVHSFAKQKQGTVNKAIIPAILVSKENAKRTKVSLYRPETKKGDPRIWIYGLKECAMAGDLLAIGFASSQFVVINCSTLPMPEYLDGNDSVAWQLRRRRQKSTVFEELHSELRSICRKGYVPTGRAGDTGVGFTLESMLGISANSSKKPDYKGIELKASRLRTAKSGQSTIFSQVPNWRLSRLKGSKDILDERGRYSEKKQRRQLFHEISSKSPNSYSLQLEVRDSVLEQVYVPDDSAVIKDVVWQMEKLQERFAQKHRETVWVTALTEGRGDSEEFWYRYIKHTYGVDSAAFPILLASGAITVHYLIKETPTGAAKDQGYLFKTSSQNLQLLFESVDEYDLTQ